MIDKHTKNEALDAALERKETGRILGHAIVLVTILLVAGLLSVHYLHKDPLDPEGVQQRYPSPTATLPSPSLSDRTIPAPSTTTAPIGVGKPNSPDEGAPFVVGQVEYAIRGYEWVPRPQPEPIESDEHVEFHTGPNTLLRVDLTIKNLSPTEMFILPHDIQFLPYDMDAEVVGEPAPEQYADYRWDGALMPSRPVNTSVFFAMDYSSTPGGKIRLGDPVTRTTVHEHPDHPDVSATLYNNTEVDIYAY